MKIITIFEEKLYCIKYKDKGKYEHELERHISNWSNPKILNKIAYNKGLVGNEVMNFQKEVKEDLLIMTRKIKEHANSDTLFDFFEPYHKKIEKNKPFQESKGKFENNRRKTSLLRVYALRINSNCFLITGCGIKTTRATQDEIFLEKQADKMEEIRGFLISKGITPDEFIYSLDF